MRPLGQSDTGNQSRSGTETTSTNTTADKTDTAKQDNKPAASSEKGADGQELDQQEKQEVRELKQRDQEVRRHEQAHIAAGGSYVRGGARYEYDTGPDGKQYAVGGEVSIDTSEENTPRATITKMQTVRKAALAPAEPSGQDRAVAAAASQKENHARMELREEQQTEQEERTRKTQSENEARETSGTDGASRTAQASEAPEAPERPGHAAGPPPVSQLTSRRISHAVATTQQQPAPGQLFDQVT